MTASTSETVHPTLWDVGGVWGSKVGLNGPPKSMVEKYGLLGRKSREVITQLIYGFGARSPKVGDFIASPRNSGRTAIFRVTEVEWCRDPSDMWTGGSLFLGYADESTVAPLITECVKGKPGFEGLITWAPPSVITGGDSPRLIP